MVYQTLHQEYLHIPIVTRIYTTACVLTTLAVQLDLVSPFQLYFNPILIVYQYQFWRIITTFLFFGTVGFNFFFNIIFTYRYCRMLEEGSFRGRTADFVMMFVFGAIIMIVSFEKPSHLIFITAYIFTYVYAPVQNTHTWINFQINF